MLPRNPSKPLHVSMSAVTFSATVSLRGSELSEALTSALAVSTCAASFWADDPQQLFEYRTASSPVRLIDYYFFWNVEL